MSAARRDSAPGKGGAIGATEQSKQQANSTDLNEQIKARFLAGGDVRLIDYPAEMRQEIIGVIARLRDELPIKSRWTTIRESFLGETRLRARCYRIPGDFLHDDQGQGNV